MTPNILVLRRSRPCCIWLQRVAISESFSFPRRAFHWKSFRPSRTRQLSPSARSATRNSLTFCARSSRGHQPSGPLLTEFYEKNRGNSSNAGSRLYKPPCGRHRRRRQPLESLSDFSASGLVGATDRLENIRSEKRIIALVSAANAEVLKVLIQPDLPCGKFRRGDLRNWSPRFCKNRVTMLILHPHPVMVVLTCMLRRRTASENSSA